MIKLGHTIGDLDVFGTFWRWHVNNGKNLLGTKYFPSLDTMYPKITPKYYKNTHFPRLRLILNFWHLLKHNCSLSICVFKSSKICTNLIKWLHYQCHWIRKEVQKVLYSPSCKHKLHHYASSMNKLPCKVWVVGNVFQFNSITPTNVLLILKYENSNGASSLNTTPGVSM